MPQGGHRLRPRAGARRPAQEGERAEGRRVEEDPELRPREGRGRGQGCGCRGQGDRRPRGSPEAGAQQGEVHERRRDREGGCAGREDDRQSGDFGQGRDREVRHAAQGLRRQPRGGDQGHHQGGPQRQEVRDDHAPHGPAPQAMPPARPPAPGLRQLEGRRPGGGRPRVGARHAPPRQEDEEPHHRGPLHVDDDNNNNILFRQRRPVRGGVPQVVQGRPEGLQGDHGRGARRGRAHARGARRGRGQARGRGGRRGGPEGGGREGGGPEAGAGVRQGRVVGGGRQEGLQGDGRRGGREDSFQGCLHPARHLLLRGCEAVGPDEDVQGQGC
mmetsp:Transcript_12765/g.33722  ORF Transcript_12765/g.33722 Transcript_12765/m.33722 type:complete len:329 (-) Transcript_12765:602-1588(-)